MPVLLPQAQAQAQVQVQEQAPAQARVKRGSGGPGRQTKNGEWGEHGGRCLGPPLPLVSA